MDSHVEILTARRGEVGSQIQQMLRSGASTIHVADTGSQSQVELAGYVLDEDAWERIVSDVEAASLTAASSLIGKRKVVKWLSTKRVRRAIKNWRSIFGLVKQEKVLWAKITRSA